MPSVNIPTSAGYGRRGPSDTSAGSVFAPEWAVLMGEASGASYGVNAQDAWKVTRGQLDREIVISAGQGFGYGVLDTTTEDLRFQLPAPGSGTLWHLIATHRDWATRQSSFKNIAGSSVAALPTREHVVGTVDDQPIALVSVTAGQAQVSNIIDLRVWSANAGAYALDELVLQYLNGLGTRVRIVNTLWERTLDGLGSPAWLATDVTPDTGWTACTPYDGNWQVSGAGGYRSLSVRRVGKRVTLSGVLRWTPSVTTYPGFQGARIPAGYRPSARELLDVYTSNGPIEVSAYPNGEITLAGGNHTAGPRDLVLHGEWWVD